MAENNQIEIEVSELNNEINNPITQIENPENIKSITFYSIYNYENEFDIDLTKFTEIEELNLIFEELSAIKTINLKGLFKIKKINAPTSYLNEFINIEKLKNLDELTVFKIDRHVNIENICYTKKLTVFQGLNDFIHLFENLEELYCENFNMIENIKNKANIKKLSIRNVKISHHSLVDINAIEHFKNIEYLDLSKNRITNIEKIDKLKTLVHLNLNNNLIEKIQQFHNLKKLKTLKIKHNRIKKIENLENLNSLENLEISLKKIKGIENLYKNKKLKKMTINEETILEKIVDINVDITKIAEINDSEVVYDGIIDNDLYFSSEIKLLWILKETYSDDTWSYSSKFKDSEWLKENGRSIPTLKRVIYTTYGILKNCEWGQIPYSNTEEAFPPLQEISLINIKKIPGGSSANEKEIQNACSRNEELLKKQIELCDADVTIFGNTLQFFNDEVFNLNSENKQISEFGNHFYEKNNKLYIHTWHPAVRGKGFTDEGYVMDIVNIVKNWRKKRKTNA